MSKKLKEDSICRLCLNVRELRNSHIIPEFLYTQVYDEYHRLPLLSTDPSHKTDYRRQKGIYEKLLCGVCEVSISKHERYVCGLLSGKMGTIAEDSGYPQEIIGIDYTALKIFQLSILWRASISSHKFFEAVCLGDHEEVIRKMILTENPGEDYEYPCIMAKVFTNIPFTQSLEGLIIGPEKLRLLNHESYRFTFGSYVWRFLVSRQVDLLPRPQPVLQKDGSLILLMAPAEKTNMFAGLADELRQQGKLSE